MNPLIRHLIGRWYDPDVAKNREERTEAAQARAVEVRVYAEDVDRRVKQLDKRSTQLRASASRANQRLATRDH